MSVEIRNITKFYGKQKAVDNISFRIEKGQVAGFIGPNGAGKSTTMKIITGYLPPTDGVALVSGFDTRRDSMQVRKILGYLPENNPLYPEMYVREYLKYVADLYPAGLTSAQKSDNIDKAVEMTGLTREQYKKIGALSKGYRQRTGLAQAIIHDPEVLILDEPTSGLDPGQIIEIRNLIKLLGKEKTVLLSTHIMQEVEAICDRVILINKGQIKAEGTTGEISAGAGNVQISLIVEFDKTPDVKALKNLPGILNLTSHNVNQYLFEAMADPDPRQTIFDFAVNKGLKILSMQTGGLEDVFRRM